MNYLEGFGESAVQISESLQLVEFVIGVDAQEVLLSGSWDEWSKKVKLSRNSSSTFVKTMELACGSYEYKYIADGKWIYDKTKPRLHTGVWTNNFITVGTKQVQP
jgi:hypothetical protein